ncbi:MAG: hypothetical protein IJS02_00305 [Bacteroidales bacterium]|nr:hypothetical protein [Bacteroidales bacterium]
MEEVQRQEKSLKSVVIVLAILAALLLAGLAYIWITKSNLVKELNIEKEDITAQMIELQKDYADLKTSNDTLNANLAIEREKVDQLIERFQKTEATNRAQIRQYEQELGTLRSIMKHYIVQIDSLNSLNIALREEASLARQEAAASQRQYEDLRSTTDAYAAQVEKGSVIKARAITLNAINASNKITDRSSRVEKLRTDFTLIENSIAKTGWKTIYIRVKGPDGILMTSDEQKLFSCNGEEMMSSASREVDYQGAEVEMSIYFSNGTPFVKGVYTVDVYSNEALLGSADLILR